MGVYKKIIEIMSIIIWLYMIKDTHANYYSYIFVAILACAYCITNKNDETRILSESTLLSALLSIATILGNYYLLENMTKTQAIWNVIVIVVGGIVCFYQIFEFGKNVLVKINVERRDDDEMIKNRKSVFFLTIFLFVVIHMLYVYFCIYPGSLQYDSLVQLREIETGRYTNHHPVIMTWMIKMAIELAFLAGRDKTFGIFIYIFIQVICISVSIAFLIYTLYETRGKKVSK